MLDGRFLRRWCLVVVLVAVAVAGCTGEREGPSGTLPPTSESPAESSTSATPTPTEPDVPVPTPAPEAEEFSELGAKAFNVFWTEALDYAYQTLDTGPFASASAPSCSFCYEGVIATLQPRAGQGYVYAGGEISTLDQSILAFEGTTVTISAIVSIAELVVTDPQGNPDPDSEAAHTQFQILNTLTWQDPTAGWIVTDSRGGDL